MVVRRTDNTRAVATAISLGIRNGIEDAARQEVEHVKSAFNSGQDALGRPWVPLAASTLRSRAGGGSTPLVKTGALRDSISYSITDRGGVTFGSSSPYAGIHEFGTARIPRRAFLAPAAIHFKNELLHRSVIRHVARILATIGGLLR